MCLTVKETEKKNYNLDFKNLNGGVKVEYKELEELLNNLEKKEKQITALLEKIRSNL